MRSSIKLPDNYNKKINSFKNFFNCEHFSLALVKLQNIRHVHAAC